MDYLTFIAEMTKALAWPLVTLALGIAFRSQIQGLLKGIKLKKLEKGEFKAEFDSVAQEIRGELPAKPDQPALPENIHNRMEQLIVSSPSGAILEAWKQIEGKVSSAAERAKVSRGSFKESLNDLVRKGLIQEATMDSILGLQKLRSLAVHAPSDRIGPKEAREFIAMAEAAIWSMDQNLKKS